MRNIRRIHDLVMDTLIKMPHTRNSDTALYLAICLKTNPEVEFMRFGDALARENVLGMPKYESVSRARRKIQAENPLLRASEDITDERYENWKVVREYAIE